MKFRHFLYLFLVIQISNLFDILREFVFIEIPFFYDIFITILIAFFYVAFAIKLLMNKSVINFLNS